MKRAPDQSRHPGGNSRRIVRTPVIHLAKRPGLWESSEEKTGFQKRGRPFVRGVPPLMGCFQPLVAGGGPVKPHAIGGHGRRKRKKGLPCSKKKPTSTGSDDERRTQKRKIMRGGKTTMPNGDGVLAAKDLESQTTSAKSSSAGVGRRFACENRANRIQRTADTQRLAEGKHNF